MKSVVLVIAVSILTAFAFAPASVAGRDPAMMASKAMMSTAGFVRPASMAPTLKTPVVLAQLSPEPGYASEDAAGHQNEPVRTNDADNSAQSDDQGNGDEAQNGVADNSESDQTAQNEDNADNTNPDAGDAVENQGGGADQNADISGTRER